MLIFSRENCLGERARIVPAPGAAARGRVAHGDNEGGKYGRNSEAGKIALQVATLPEYSKLEGVVPNYP